METCMEVMRKLTEFLQGSLPETEARHVRSHVAECNNCRLVLRSAEKTLRKYFGSNLERRQSAA